ncbi:gamma-glutamyltransferase [Streptomyces sp. NPDC093221]|uniref:gamma-glutamyltransferase n=1 Tax=Streptomyces sp. NPDC093221 TaxID=3366032 RepID=UPI003829F9B1
MIPADVNDAPPMVYTDSIDVPVLLRDGPDSRPFKQWRTAAARPWPSNAAFPENDGWYLPTTTWREILKAATEVGRDVTPNLLQVPQLAHSELVARVAPLYAYIGIHHFVPRKPKKPLPGSTGRRLTVNAVYEYATEQSARHALGYRLGMTMAEWACRSLMGLGQTRHIEDGGPDPTLEALFQNPSLKLPDLWGRHDAENAYWLIEAKGGNVRVGRLRDGWKQLEGGSTILGAYDHRRVLVGASVQPGGDLFLTVDHDHHPGLPPLHHTGGNPGAPSTPEDHLGEDDDALMGAARAQMLTFLALRSAPASRLRTVALSSDRTTRRRRRDGLTTPLEDDEATLAARAVARVAGIHADDPSRRAWARAIGLDDFLTCRIPGTELQLGMSSRLFAACAQLHREDQAIAARTPGMRAEDRILIEEDADEDAELERRRVQGRIFREQQWDARTRIAPVVRAAYDRGDTEPWNLLLPSGQEPPLDLTEHPGLLEAATPETYLALRREDLPQVGR